MGNTDSVQELSAMNTDRNPVAERLQQARQTQGISIKSLAVAAGISEDYLRLAEDVTATLSGDALGALATTLRIDLSWLASGVENTAVSRRVADGVLMQLSPAEARLIEIYSGNAPGISVGTEHTEPRQVRSVLADAPVALMPLSALLANSQRHPLMHTQGSTLTIFANAGGGRSLLSDLTPEEAERMWAWSRERDKQGAEASLLLWPGWVEVLQRRYPDKSLSNGTDQPAES